MPGIQPRRAASAQSGAWEASRSTSNAHVDAVVEPLLARPADAVVERLRGAVVERRLPLQGDGAALAHRLHAALDQGLADPPTACLGDYEEVVHQPDAGGL